jgi:agmatine deiminase
MKSSSRILLAAMCIVALTMQAQAQQDEHRLLPQEHAAMPAYLQSVARTGIVTPPTSPVRASAEWEEIDALMVTWTSYTAVLKEIVRYAQLETEVQIICTDSNAVKSYLNSNGVTPTRVKYVIAPYNSIWSRDYGQWNIYTHDVDTLALIDWIYNRPRPKDDTVPSSIARYAALPIYATTTPPYNLIATGGNFMCDGFGTGFSSNLIVDENPGLPTTQIDDIMQQFMGIDRYIKFPTLPYDDIHHIDMHMKLLDEETLLVGQYPTGVSDGPQIEANLQYILANYNSVFGTPYKVIRMPMPPDAQGRYPSNNGDYRTYTNAVFVNKTVLVPSYQQQYDTTAQRIWQAALPGYKIQMINCNSIITALGALHCITKEVSTRDPLLISHQPLADTYNAASPYTVDARIQHRSGIATASLHYRTDTLLPYQVVPMSLTNALTHTWTGDIPAQAVGETVYYYVGATAVSGKSQVRPMPAPAGYWSFDVLGFVGTEAALGDAAARMEAAYPNPSRGMICIPVILANELSGSLLLNDMMGREIAVIHAGPMPAGRQTYLLQTEGLAAGVYTLAFHAGESTLVQRLLVK